MPRKFGIEIEFLLPHATSVDTLAMNLTRAGINTSFEGYTHAVMNRWKIVTDASVSGMGYYGYELVSPPMEFNEESFEIIRKVCEILGNANAGVKRCCGLHVHVDAHGLTLDKAKALINRYVKYERDIDKFMPNSRRANNNVYCKTLVGNTYSHATDIQSLIADRHSKLNVKSFPKYNTIEFRQHSGTVNAEKIINWVKFCVLFFEKSVNLVQEVASTVTINLPRSIRGIDYANRYTPEVAYQIMNATNHRKINSLIKAVDYIVKYHESYIDSGYGVKIDKLREAIGGRARVEYVNELNAFVRNITSRRVDLISNNYCNLHDVKNFLQVLIFWKEVYSPIHGYSRDVVQAQTSSQIDNNSDRGLFDGIPPSVAQFYREREMDLAA